MAVKSLRKTKVSKPMRAAGRLKFIENVAAPLAKRAAVYVAVIVRGGFKDYPYASRLESNRHDDGWFALMGEDKDRLVTEALAKARAFGSNYEVAVGTLDEMVIVPTIFKYETL